MILNFQQRLVFAVLLLACYWSEIARCQSQTEAAPAKKLLEWGWDEPDTGFMREHIGEMEESPLMAWCFM